MALPRSCLATATVMLMHTASSLSTRDGVTAVAQGAALKCSSVVQGRVIGSTRAFHNTAAASAAACCQLCSADERCAAFNYELDSNQCYFQADAMPCEPDTAIALQRHRNCSKPSAISGVRGAAPSGGGDLGPTRVTIGDVYHHTDPRFKCWNIDPSPNREWEYNNLSRSAPGGEKLYALAKASLPGFLRFGGGGADHMAYVIPGGPPPYINCTSPGGPPDTAVRLGKQPWHCLNSTWLENLLDFADYSGAELIFGLDINSRDITTGQWDPAPAKSLIEFATARGHKFFGFELGNEQNNAFSAQQEAADFLILQKLLVKLFPDAANRPKIVGPDPHGFHDTPKAGDKTIAFLEEFASECKKLGVELFGLTHHEYTEIKQNLRTPPPAASLDKTGGIAAAVNASLAQYGVGIWAGEIGPHNGGSPPCDNSSERWANWADTFWYLDSMALKAKHGYGQVPALTYRGMDCFAAAVYCRQDFIGIDYGLLDCATNDPLPVKHELKDYFGGVLWSKLMGPGVSHALSNTTVRAYAHCHATSSLDLTVLLLNLDTTEPSFVTIDMGTAAVEQAGGRPTVEYHLTGKPHQQTVKLNDKTLAATAEGVLPPMLGRAGVSTAVELAPVRPCMQLRLLISIGQTNRAIDLD